MVDRAGYAGNCWMNLYTSQNPYTLKRLLRSLLEDSFIVDEHYYMCDESCGPIVHTTALF